MSTSARRQTLPIFFWLAALAVVVGGELFWALNEFNGEGPAFVEGWFLLLSSLAVTTIGVLILARVPGHRIGWLLYAIGLALCASSLLDEYAVYALMTNPDTLPLGAEAAAVEIIGAAAFGLMAVYLFLLFPDGHLPSPKWRPIVQIGTVAIVCVMVGGLLRAGELGGPFEGIENPLGVGGVGQFFGVLSVVSLLFVGICGIFGLASLVIRFRKADGIERHQLEWVFFGGACLALGLAVGYPLRLTGVVSPSVQSILFSISFTAVPVTMGIAILRYRLYDIDMIINRTLVYVPLTGILAGVYVATTGLLRTLFTELTDWGSDAAIAFSTLIVAGSLTPLKNYLQAFVDRKFKDNPDPEKEARRLATQARSVIEVLQQETFLRKYLRELVTVFGARGGAIRVGYSTYAEGEWLGDDAMVIELVCDGSHRGHIGVARRLSGAPYSLEDPEHFAQLSAIVAEVISLGSLFQPAVSFSGVGEHLQLSAQEEKGRLS